MICCQVVQPEGTSSISSAGVFFLVRARKAMALALAILGSSVTFFSSKTKMLMKEGFIKMCND